ncbi:reprolysin-like metallopeptidase [Kaistella antarctica]|uniref:Por secretion system C-terminal sorting domain n=1 Tax=Kaistella antarctica TaxID=266748 RepID=A0A3S4W5V6_9FLAO|nr:zinc-dependent metalloprotease family protein [Kaistella antarctica]SEV85079.1 Por secretion system C-terminal sorting domain-containing protein [Kaistella antarctica]VEI01059.1 Por secretion system C-terminal sorting domain [Kaistella antarctica]
MKTKIFTTFLLFLALMSFGQNYWTKAPVTPTQNLAQRWVQPKAFTLYQVNLAQLKNDLAQVPNRLSNDNSKTVIFPTSDGKFKEYVVQEASVMEAALQAKYPEIRSYAGWEKNNKQNSIRFSVTPDNGISAMYFDGWTISYLDKFTADQSKYIFYKREDLPVNDRLFECSVQGLGDQMTEDPVAKAPLVTDGQFRTYRLALAATAEYTAYHGGTVAKALAAMAVTMTRVNGIYEKSISVTMVMVANNNLLIYTDPVKDPYTNDDGFEMLDENTANVNAVIGAANFDVGHVFSTGGGGVAGLGVICTSRKAEGVTGSGAPINDPFDIDYVAHEMGHQFGGNHTFRSATGSCSGNANNTTAFEPGSGSTIMAYAGICGINNVQSNSDAYFHSASINEMYKVVTRVSDCAVKVSNNNQVPTADAGLDYIIPRGTAFVLTGLGTDPDNDPITYLWEQLDRQTNVQPPVSTAIGGPVYRSLTPTVSPSRYFPMMSSILANNLVPKWEVTPSVPRLLNFSLLVNDNKVTGNQAARDQTLISVVAAGPFKVTSQTTNIEYDGAVPMTVTWDVAGTDIAPINTQNVQVLLTRNGGVSFEVLAARVPNNGSADVMLPNENIASARIMVKAVDNIYFAINFSYFKIKKGNLATVDSKLKSLSIYPNPAKNEVNVRMNKSEGAKYMIYDASGRLLTSGNVSAEGKINTDKISNGNYILTIQINSGEKISEKLMIKK